MMEELAQVTMASGPDDERARRYHRTQRILGVAGYLVDLAALLLLLFAGWTVAIRSYAFEVSPRFPLALLVDLLLVGAILGGVGLPLGFASDYWLEHRYGLSKLSLWGWIKDQLKGWAVGGILVALAAEFVYWSLRRFPDWWWMISGTAFIAFSVLLANLAPVLILPLFFKFKPLENRALADRLVALSERAGTHVNGVFEWALGEKTRKANAALLGLGNTRRIILADTLLGALNDDEVEAVLAHELGHHVHRHLLRGLAVQIGATYVGFWLVDQVLRRLTPVFGYNGLADFANLPLIILVGVVLSLLLLPAVNANSRHMEWQADAYALQAIPQKAAFVAGLEKLARLNLAERAPHPWIEFIFHSHPSISKRIAAAQQAQ
jgi:Zn-dependent protease with chaperone function